MEIKKVIGDHHGMQYALKIVDEKEQPYSDGTLYTIKAFFPRVVEKPKDAFYYQQYDDNRTTS